jgi:hypothetical protein
MFGIRGDLMTSGKDGGKKLVPPGGGGEREASPPSRTSDTLLQRFHASLPLQSHLALTGFIQPFLSRQEFSKSLTKANFI